MIFKIARNGALRIKRGSEYKAAICPHVTEETNCGDHCVLFSEPEEAIELVAVETPEGYTEKEVGYIELQICDSYLKCRKEDFKDEREY